MIRKIIMGTAWMMVSLGLYAQNNEMLTDKDKIIVTISAYTARGELAELKDALNRGLDVGLTVSEAREILVHLYAYTGFPRSLNGLMTLMNVLEERKTQGKKDVEGREASPIVDTGRHAGATGKLLCHPARHRHVRQAQTRPVPQLLPGDLARSLQHRSTDGYCGAAA